MCCENSFYVIILKGKKLCYENPFFCLYVLVEEWFYSANIGGIIDDSPFRSKPYHCCLFL